MNAFITTATTFLSRYANNLLKHDCEQALSGKVRGDVGKNVSLISSAISIMDSFQPDDFLVCGLHRINGSLSQQQKAVKIFEHANGVELKNIIIGELSAEDKAGCLRLLLRKLPDSLFPYCQRVALVDIADSIKSGKLSNENALKALQILVYFIPESSKICLKKLLSHLKDVVSNADVNRMSIENVALMFASTVFPLLEERDSMTDIKENVDKFCKLFPVLLNHADEIFYLPDELIDTLESSLEKHVEEDTLNECLTPTPNEDPEIVLSETFSQRSTPSRSTTDLELAKLMAEIYAMPDGVSKNRLIKRMKRDQRKQLGLTKKHTIFGKLLRSSNK